MTRIRSLRSRPDGRRTLPCLARAVAGLAIGFLTACATSNALPSESEPDPASLAPATTIEAPPAETTAAPKPQPVLGVDHVGLTVTDLEASRDLFVEVLGFRVGGQDPSYPAYFLNNGSIAVTLWRATDPDKAVTFDRKNNVGLHHLALAVASFEDLDALHITLAAYPGVTIEFAPEPAYGGPSKHMMFREPSGNRIELVHRPPR